MKQHITIDQFNELNNKQKRELEAWCFTNSYFTRLAVPGEPARFTDTKTFTSYVLNPIELSIGQMIEFLNDSGEYSLLNVHSEVLGLPHNWGVGIIENFNLCDGWVEDEYIIKYQEDVELCDTLWKAVKEELENLTNKE